MLNSFEFLSVNWPINSLLIGNLTFGKYEVAVLKRVIGTLGMILMAGGWVVVVAVLWRDNI